MPHANNHEDVDPCNHFRLYQPEFISLFGLEMKVQSKFWMESSLRDLGCKRGFLWSLIVGKLLGAWEGVRHSLDWLDSYDVVKWDDYRARLKW